jgi:threonine/homoserine/homoserine lactone efflux protein
MTLWAWALFCAMSHKSRHRAGRRAGPRFRRTIDRPGGGLLIAAGAELSRIRRG